MTLTEQNLEVTILEQIQNSHNWLETYQNLKAKVDDMEYSYLQYSYDLYFCYYMIKNKVNIVDFSNVIKKIYNDTEEYKLGNFFESFFYSRDKGIELREYSQLDKYNNKEHLNDNISYLFLNLYENENSDNTKNTKYRLEFDKNTLPYLQQLLKDLPTEKSNALWSGRFQYFINFFINNISELKPILELAMNNDSLKKDNLFLSTLLKTFGHSLYDRLNQPEKNKKLYLDLSTMIPNFDHILLNSLLTINNNNKYDIDLDILNFYMEGGQSDKAIVALNYHYQETLTKEKLSQLTNMKAQINRSVFHSSIMVTFERYPDFVIPYDNIDISKPLKENLIYLALLELKFKNIHDHECDLDVIKYFLNELEIKHTDLYEDMSIYVKKDFILKLKDYFIHQSYNNLDEQLPINETIKSKIKI